MTPATWLRTMCWNTARSGPEEGNTIDPHLLVIIMPWGVWFIKQCFRLYLIDYGAPSLTDQVQV
jgi:hypothetical protein